MRSNKEAARSRRRDRTRRKFMRCNNPSPQTNIPLTACPTPGPSPACGEAERPARLPDTRRSGVAARKHISEARHLQATRRVQGRVGPAEARTLQVFSHFFTPKPRARSGTPHRSPRVNRPPAAAELPGVAARGAQRTRRGIPPFQRASLPGCHHPPGSTRGRPCCGGRRPQAQRRLQAGADIDGPERSALAATAKATAQPPAPGSRGHHLARRDDLTSETRRVARHFSSPRRAKRSSELVHQRSISRECGAGKQARPRNVWRHGRRPMRSDKEAARSRRRDRTRPEFMRATTPSLKPTYH